MPLKPVFSVDLDDSQFKRFKVLFEKYEDSLSKLPKGWEKVAAGIGAVGASHGNITGDLEEQIRLVMKKIQLEELEARALDKSDSKWKSIKSTVKGIDTSLEKGTIRLAKWGAMATGVLGGLGAIGIGAGLFGIDRLSGIITANRRQAMGLGTSYGQLKSYQTNYSRLINPTGLLEGIASAKYDVTSPQYTALISAGVSQKTLKNGSTADIAAEFLTKIPQLFKNIPKEYTGAYAKAYGVDQIMPMNDLIAYLSADQSERDKIRNKTLQDAGGMDISSDAQKQWADFTTQLDRATKTIEAKFMEKLTPIEPGLEKLSDSAVKLVDALADSGAAKTIIADMASGIDWLSGKINEKSFHEDLEHWFDWIGKSSKSLLSWVSSFSAISPASAGEAPTPKNLNDTSLRSGDYVGPNGQIIRGPGNSFDVNNPYTGSYKDSPGSGELTKLITQVSKEEGLDPRIMEGIRAGESHHNSKYDVKDDALESSWGPFQLNRRRGLGVQFEKETGLDVRDPSTIPAQARWVAKYIRRTGNLTPWRGFHGLSDPDSRWGDSGYNPNESIPHRGRMSVDDAFPHIQLPTVMVRSNTGNNPVLAHALTSQPSTQAEAAK